MTRVITDLINIIILTWIAINIVLINLILCLSDWVEENIDVLWFMHAIVILILLINIWQRFCCFCGRLHFEMPILLNRLLLRSFCKEWLLFITMLMYLTHWNWEHVFQFQKFKFEFLHVLPNGVYESYAGFVSKNEPFYVLNLDRDGCIVLRFYQPIVLIVVGNKISTAKKLPSFVLCHQYQSGRAKNVVFWRYF